jgi:tartrate-resistant acid phosphatase type 5
MKVFLCLLLFSSFPVLSAKKKLLCFIGDTGSDWFHQDRIAARLEKENCDSVHFLGDIIYPRGLKNAQDPEFHDRFWDPYEDLTATGKKPDLYLVMGNHDHQGSIKAWEDLAKIHRKIIFPSPYYLIQRDKTCLVHLETNYFLEKFPPKLREEELKWLGTLDLKNCDLKIALGHHPYRSSGRSHGHAQGQMKEILEKYILGKFDYYLAGHEHILSDEGSCQGTRLLISGAGGKPAKGQLGGYLVIEVVDKKIDLRFVRVP